MDRDFGPVYFLLLAILLTGWGMIAAYGMVANYPNCVEFGFEIPTRCCCTASCCQEAGEQEFTHIGDDNYRSNVTGQVLRRTGWSPDGRFIRCACDQVDGVWKWRPEARVHCVFPPLPSS